MNLEDKTWLQFYNEVALRNPTDQLSRIGLLISFTLILPNTLDWVMSVIRQRDMNVLRDALIRCMLYLEAPNQRYWIKRKNLSGDSVEECSIFTPHSFAANDKEEAELLSVTKIF